LKCKGKIEINRISSGEKVTDNSYSELITTDKFWKNRITRASLKDEFWGKLDAWQKDPSAIPKDKADIYKLYTKRTGL
jgi:hypothetical protein